MALGGDRPWAIDVRWAGDDALFLGGLKRGVLRLELGPLAGPIEGAVRAADAHQVADYWLAGWLGVSPAYLAFASPIFSLAWEPRGEEGAAGETAMARTYDLDLHGDRLLAMAGRRNDEGHWAPDGAMVWIGTLGSGLSDMRPVYYSLSGPRAQTFDRCGMLDLGAVRFLPDGRFVVVPGVEDGILLYDREGRLLRTWESLSVGLDSECDLRDDELRLYRMNVPPRFEWLDRRRVVDEILPLPEGPALVMRSVRDGLPIWELVILSETGKPRRIPLPLRSPAGRFRVKGDVQGERLAFVIFETPLGPDDRVAPARLVVTEAP